MSRVNVLSVLALVTVMTVGLLLGGRFTLATDGTQDRTDVSPPPVELAYEVHLPISIHNDSEFAATAVIEGWNGSGTQDAPYRIVEYRILSILSGACISIRNVDCYFVISDCILAFEGYGTGVQLYSAPHGSIESCTIHTLSTAIDVSCSSGVRIFNNLLSNATRGIVLTESSECEISTNSFNNCSLWIDAWRPENWLHTVSDNYVNGRYLGYFRELSGTFIDAQSYGQVILACCQSVDVFGGAGVGLYHSIESGIVVGYCQDCLIHDCFSNWNYYGAYIDHSNGTVIEYCEMHYNQYGVVLNRSWYCNVTMNYIEGNTETGVLAVGSGYLWMEGDTIVGSNVGAALDSCYTLVACVNDVSQNGVGMTLVNSSFSHISENIFSDNDDVGLRLLSGCNHSVVSNNDANVNAVGVEMEDSSFTFIGYNTISFNDMLGLKLGYGCESCGVILNYFIYNGENARDEGGSNDWDENTWSDYSGTGVYSIPGAAGSIDHFPSQYTQTTSVTTTTTIPDTTITPTGAATTTPSTTTTNWNPPSSWPDASFIAWISLGSLSVIGTAIYAIIRTREPSTRQ